MKCFVFPAWERGQRNRVNVRGLGARAGGRRVSRNAWADARVVEQVLVEQDYHL